MAEVAPSLLDTLRATSAHLLLVRGTIASSGHLHSLTEIDTLLAVAQAEVERHLARASVSRSGRR